jgi:hypothetical protein
LNSLFISIDNKVSLYFLVLFLIEGDDNTRVQSMVTPNWIFVFVLCRDRIKRLPMHD